MKYINNLNCFRRIVENETNIKAQKIFMLCINVFTVSCVSSDN